MELVRILGLLILGVYGLAISDSETDLKLKILGLQRFAKTEDSEYGKDLSEFTAIQKRKDIFIDLFGGNYRRRPKMIKVRRKARIPRRSYGGGYSAPRRSSYKVPKKVSKPRKPAYSPPQFYQSPRKAYPPPPTPEPYYVPSTTPSYSPPSYGQYPTPQPHYAPSTQTPIEKPQYQPPQPKYPPPSYTSKPSYSEPSYSEEPSSPASYSYHYEVEDGEYQAWEKRSGSSTQGSYSVLLPDGRTMIVTYTVPDDDTGYMAQVDYTGEAHYPETPRKSAYSSPQVYSAIPSPAPFYG